jgi:hypothetical protein
VNLLVRDILDGYLIRARIFWRLECDSRES